MELTTIECLVLSQAVYEHGADAWQTVSTVLSNHPALARPTSFFSPQSCHQIYLRLMNDASLECSEANNVPHAPLNLVLAKRHYSARLIHLRDLIATEEVKFKRIVAEIDEIRSGAWDDKIRANLIRSGNANPSDVADREPVSEPPQECTTVTDDREAVEKKDVDIVTIDEQPPIEDQQLKLPPDVPADDQIMDAAPTVQDVTQELTPTHIIEISPEESMSVQVSEVNQPAPAPQMDPDEPNVFQEEKADIPKPKRKIPDLDSFEEGQREKKRPRGESISTDVDEQTPRKPSAANSDLASHHQTPPSVPNKRFQTVIGMLHSQISQHRNGNIFHNPIKNSEAPDYHDIIKRPMDLKTIKARVKDGIISTSLEFQRDVYLMFANAMMYNRPTSDIYHMAEEMMAESEMHINAFRQTEGFIRSTRS